MFRILFLALAAALASACVATSAPLEVYGRLPSIEQVTVSPSGKFVAYVLTSGEERTIGVESLPDRKPHFIGKSGNAKIRDIAWAGDGYLIVTTSTTARVMDLNAGRREWSMAFAIDLAKGKTNPLLSDVGEIEALNTIHGQPQVRMIDGKPTVFVTGQYFVNGQGHFGLFQADLAKGSARLVQKGSRGAAYDWVVDRDGQPLAEALYHRPSTTWSLMVRAANGRWRKAYAVEAPIETPELIGVGRDGRSVIVAMNDDEAGAGWRELSLETGAWGETLEAGGGVLDPLDGRLIGVHRLDGEDGAYTFFDPADAAVWRGILKAYPGELVELVSWSADRKKMVVRVDSPTLGPAFALVDRTTREALWLGPEYTGLREADISPVRFVRYKAADGLEITGYLTLPKGRPEHNLPLVVMPHGGPAARDRPGFDWWAQALASRGYAVLQPNYRGSSGLGEEFLEAGFGQWGRKMQTDLSDGVRDLARQGVADPKRVCIVGASYSGYAALAGATIDRGVYRCAVSVAGVSDLQDLVTEAGDSNRRYWRRFVGVEHSRDLLLAAYSPVAQAAKADAPILLVHGRDDTVVVISHSRKMAAALSKAGKPHEYVELPGEDHYLSRSETRQRMLSATVTFLEKHNPPN